MRGRILLLLLLQIVAVSAHAERWIALWTEDDSWVGMEESGAVWQLIPGNDPIPAGDFGPGPWVAFSKSWSDHVHYALHESGEVWSLSGLGSTAVGELFRTLPGDREWCALLTVPEGCEGPQFALTCNGEIWLLADPPELAGTFDSPPISISPESWGEIRATFR